MKLKCFFVPFGIAVLMHGLPAAMAQNWTQTGFPTNYYCLGIAMSADGCKLAAVSSGAHPIYSTDAGATWHTNQSSPHGYGSIALSADGTRMLASMEYSNGTAIFVSTNSGDIWTNAATPVASDWLAVASSGAGDRLAAAVYYTTPARPGGLIYVSTNFGTSWTSGGSPSNRWTALAWAANGSKLAAAASSSPIYLSTNFGMTWEVTASPTNNWTSIAANADGTRWIASGSGTYISTNGGSSWRLASGLAGAVASSADGTKLIIAGSSVFTSTNGGVTWKPNSLLGSWYCAASSADGSALVVGSTYSGVWTSRTMYSPRLDLQVADTNLLLSWVKPSTNFVLQQTADLKTPNWVSLTNMPSLNLSNLQEQVALPTANGGGFFRLITQSP